MLGIPKAHDEIPNSSLQLLGGAAAEQGARLACLAIHMSIGGVFFRLGGSRAHSAYEQASPTGLKEDDTPACLPLVLGVYLSKSVQRPWPCMMLG